MEQPEGHVHAEHQKFAMGEIDDVHDSKYQRQTYTYEGVNATEQYAVYHELNDGLDHLSTRSLINDAQSK